MSLQRRAFLTLPLLAAAPAALAAARTGSPAAVEAAAKATFAGSSTGAVIVARRDRVVWAGGVGSGDPAIPTPTRGTAFDALSIGKTFTAMAVMRLLDQGKLELNKPIRTYLPELPDALADIKVRHALNNDTGLPVYLEGEDFTPRTDKQALAEIMAIKPERKGGTGNRYSNVNFHLLGLMVQRIAGEPYEDAVRRLVFTPAGLRNTGFMGEARWKTQPVATGYVNGKPTGSPATWPNTWSLLGAAGIVTTVDDLYALNRAFLAGTALTPGTRGRVLASGTATYGRGPYIDEDTLDQTYGAGMYHWVDRAGRRVVFQGGDGDFGFQAVNWWRIEDDTYIGALINSRVEAKPFDRSRFIKAVLAALG